MSKTREQKLREDLEFVRDSLPKLVDGFMRQQTKELKKIVEDLERSRDKVN